MLGLISWSRRTLTLGMLLANLVTSMQAATPEGLRHLVHPRPHREGGRYVNVLAHGYERPADDVLDTLLVPFVNLRLSFADKSAMPASYRRRTYLSPPSTVHHTR